MKRRGTHRSINYRGIPHINKVNLQKKWFHLSLFFPLFSSCTMTLPVRSKSLKSSTRKRKSNNIQKRPKTWTCHPKRYTVSPRVSRWVSQHNIKRQTIATISTLSSHTNSEATLVHFHQAVAPGQDIFHTQSLLFLFGFLFFPCWWVGGFYLKVNNVSALPELDVEKRMTMHSPLIANGRTASRILLRLPAASSDSLLMDTKQLFHVWNRLMSVVSIGLTLLMIGLLVWYCIGCHVSINGTCVSFE